VKLALAFVIILSTGCFGPSLAIDPKWKPLTTITEQGTVPRGAITTILETGYVHDLAQWQLDYPVGPTRDALLHHESLHSSRQLATVGGPEIWLGKYLIDASFRWSEESKGWALELTDLVHAGVTVDTVSVATILSGDLYTLSGSKMVDYATAKAWADGVVQIAQNTH
jgi:hypothetical protein